MKSFLCVLLVCLLQIHSGASKEAECPKSFKYTVQLDKQGNKADVDIPFTARDGDKCSYKTNNWSVIEGKLPEKAGGKIVWVKDSGKFQSENWVYFLDVFTGQWICPKYCVHSMIDDVDYAVCKKIRVLI
ncbi:hypothetical protein HELRODRAFT_177814 [Helobdella robusta]|uniref:Uncharacterized protein n=1 Tax=Helobdella robusta TaxID=6412 RepID=T1FCB2_HELRO|nr:hypothetical protein HELRODRAFT_177814 [Helobdella robusta]ESN97752.1 hypothetical protein HELRODRAFT_177814 [Helobdella robusta]